jgi:hypothetical protein
MNAAKQEDLREREIRAIMKEIGKILPNPLTANQRAAIEMGVVLNLNGEA